MVKRPKELRLAPGELELMAMLWREGALTLAEAHQRFGSYGRPVGYPTMQTRLNRLAAKGWLSRSDDRPAVYSAAVTAEEVGAKRLDHWLHTTRQETVVPLVAHLISEHPLSQWEITELRQLLEDAEKARKQAAPVSPMGSAAKNRKSTKEIQP
jgi:BlaI family transcriptional regulator, penicillinase repressor